MDILEAARLTVIQIFALTMPPQIFFQREFTRSIDADDYEAFWRGLGSCHIKRIVK